MNRLPLFPLLTAVGLSVFILLLSPNAHPAEAAGEVCFATLDGANVYSSADASAVQNAVSAASAGTTIKLAGYCAGVQVIGGLTQTVQITQTLTLAGTPTPTGQLTTPPPTRRCWTRSAAGGWCMRR